MAGRDLRSYLAGLGEALLRVPGTVAPRFEVAALLRESQSSGRALLCESVAGFPGVKIAGNLLASRALAARALGTTPEQLTETWVERSRGRIAPVAAAEVPVQQVVHHEPADLAALLPLVTHYEHDAAPYLTCGVVFAREPGGTLRGMGIHRMMFRGGRRMNIFLANPPLSQFLAAAEAAGRPLEVAVALGVDPALLLAAVVKTGPLGPDKIEIAGALAGAPVPVARALTVDLDIPALAEVVIEGHVLPGVREPEGPFGENTGAYFSNTSPVFEATAVTHRRGFVFPALLPWSTDVDMLLALAAGAELLGQLRAQVRGVVDLELIGGTASFAAVVQVRDCPRHEVRRLIHLALNLDRRLKLLTVVDDDVDLRDAREVAWAMATRYQPERDTIVIEGTEPYVIDPSADDGRASKIGFDATRGAGERFDKIALPAAAVARARELLAAAGAAR